MEIANILAIIFHALGLGCVAVLVVETVTMRARAMERNLQGITQTTQWKIRATLAILLSILWISFFTGTVLFIILTVEEANLWFHSIVDFLQSFSLCSSLFFMSLITLERYSTFSCINKGQRFWTWVAIRIFAAFEISLVLVGAPMNCFSSPTFQIFSMQVAFLVGYLD